MGGRRRQAPNDNLGLSVRAAKTPIPKGLTRLRRGRRGPLSSSCFARALTRVCMGRGQCRGTLRVVGGLGLGCPRGGICFTSRVEFLRGLVVGAGGWGGSMHVCFCLGPSHVCAVSLSYVSSRLRE